MSESNPLTANKVHALSDNSISDTVVNFGVSSDNNSGTGIYGDRSTIHIAVGGSDVVTIDSSGIHGSLANLLVLTSAASVGGAATEVMTLTGLLTTDTILSVSQKTPGASSLPLLGYSTQATNHLTAIFSADPGAGAVIVVAIKR